jgi:hypothetical protein
MRLLVISVLLASTSALANPKIDPIFDGEFNMDAPACWLENLKSETVLYDDLKIAKIKIDSKIVSFHRSRGKFESEFFACGNSYQYQSDDNKVVVSISMKSSKTKKCTGVMKIESSTGTTTIDRVKSDCGH